MVVGQTGLGDGRKRLLALDGGGILGLISLQILKKIEAELAAKSAAPREFRLSQFFDYFGGTSTGAIIAAGLATGMSVDELIALYRDHAKEIFRKSRRFMVGFRHRYRHDGLARLLKENLGESSIAEMRDSGALKSLLLVVMRNATREGAWPVTTNPHDPFAGPIGDMPLWQVVRASAAAPYYFAPETITVRDREGRPDNQFIFEDGGTTAYNNPAMALYRQAVAEPHWAGHAATGVPAGIPWPSGEENLLLVSVGTGETKEARRTLQSGGRRLWQTATEVPSDLMAAIAEENDINCRFLGRCAYGPVINQELGALIRGPDEGPPAAFRYARYNAEVSKPGLSALGLGHIQPDSLQMDSTDALDDMIAIGAATAAPLDILEHFGAFVPAPSTPASPELGVA